VGFTRSSLALPNENLRERLFLPIGIEGGGDGKDFQRSWSIGDKKNYASITLHAHDKVARDSPASGVREREKERERERGGFNRIIDLLSYFHKRLLIKRGLEYFNDNLSLSLISHSE